MEKPIEAKVFLVRNEDHPQAVAELEEAGAAYCTFPHHSGKYVAVAVGGPIPEREHEERRDPPPVPKISLFPQGGK